MRIVSHFRDYYDGVQRMGADRSLVYVRNRKVVADRNVPALTGDIKFERFHDEWSRVRIESVTIGFCGRFHLLFGVVGDGSSRYHCALQGAVDDVVALADTKGKQRKLREWLEQYVRSRFLYGGLADLRVALWQEAHAGRNDEPFVRLQAPIFVARRDGGCSHSVTINDRLGQFGFQRKLDPYSAYQEIAMYLAGPLANQQDPPQDIDDETLASMKGFNEMSFRTDSPGKKRKRRAKRK
jgi:hypothetical protein